VSAHAPVLLHEAVESLNVRERGVYVDCTFGRGGHSRLILAKLGPDGRLVAIDRDPQAVQSAQAIDDPRFTIIHGAFGRLAELLARAGVTRVHGCLLDLGMSSPQLEEAEEFQRVVREFLASAFMDTADTDRNPH